MAGGTRTSAGAESYVAGSPDAGREENTGSQHSRQAPGCSLRGTAHRRCCHARHRLAQRRARQRSRTHSDYNEALALLLARLGQRGASLIDAVVDSTTARRSHPDPATRRLALEYPVDLVAADPSALRLELRRAASAAARRPGASGTGSGEKRLRLFLDLPGEDPRGLQAALSRDTPVLSPPTPSPLRTTARPPAGRAEGRGQGRAADAAFRRAVELRAMSLAVEHFQTRGWRVDDTSADHPYDLRCERNGQERHIEVKGTTGAGEQINFTAGEVRHHRQDPLRAVLFIAHGIAVRYDANGPRDHVPLAVELRGGGPRLMVRR